MTAILAFLQGHGLATLIVAFTVLSIALDSAAKIMQALGKVVPGWVGSVSNAVGQVLHFLNGNVSAAVAPAPAPSDAVQGK